MTFSPTPPTVPGFYAWKRRQDDLPSVSVIDVKDGQVFCTVQNKLFHVPQPDGQLWCRLVPVDSYEPAYREGYNDGYEQGMSDAHKYDVGGGNTSIETMKQHETDAWNVSHARKVVEGEGE